MSTDSHDSADGAFCEGHPPLSIRMPHDEARVHGPGHLKSTIAKAGFSLSVGLFFLGFLVACYCPGWYATAAVLASIGLVLGTGRLRTWSTVCLVASVVFAGIHYQAKINEQKRFEQIRQRIQLEQSASETGEP